MNQNAQQMNIVSDSISVNQLLIEQSHLLAVLASLQGRPLALNRSLLLLTNDGTSQMEQSGNMNMLLTQQQINSSENMVLTQTKLKQPMD